MIKKLAQWIRITVVTAAMAFAIASVLTVTLPATAWAYCMPDIDPYCLWMPHWNPISHCVGTTCDTQGEFCCVIMD
jgi:hypothetical protein